MTQRIRDHTNLRLVTSVFRDISVYIVTSITSLINIAGDVWMLKGDVNKQCVDL